MNKNKERLQEIHELQISNPDAEIVFCVDSNTMCEDYASTIQQIISVQLDDLYIASDGTHFSGEEEITEHYECYEEDETKIAELVKNAHRGKAIFVNMSA